MGDRRDLGRAVLEGLGWTGADRIPTVRWLVEAALLYVVWQNYALEAMPDAYALPLACLASVIYGVTWAARVRYLVRRPRRSS